MSEKTANFGYTKPAKGETGWDVDINKNFDDIDKDMQQRVVDINNRYTKTESNAKYVKPTVSLLESVDLNSVITSGFYRLPGACVNGPDTVGFGQLVVCRGGDTILQIATGFGAGEIYWRQGSNIYGDAHDQFRPWHRIWHEDNLQIGGRNYINNSNDLNITNHTVDNYGGNAGYKIEYVDKSGIPDGLDVTDDIKAAKVTLNNQGFRYMSKTKSGHNYPLNPGTYTFSVWTFVEDGYSGGVPSNYLISDSRGYYDTTKLGTWQRLKITRNIAASGNYEIAISLPWSPNSNGTGVIYIALPKLELGKIATDWTPAPEDIQSQIADLQAQINALKSS